jgi:peroxiredoxin
MPDTPRAPDIDLTQPARGRGTVAEDRRSASQLVERGALAVTDAETATAGSPGGGHAGERRRGRGAGAASFAAPSSVGHVLRSDDFLGKVPVTMVFCPEGPVTDALLRRLDDAFPRFGEARVQLLVVLAEDADAVQRRHDALGVHLPLLADPEGRLALDHGIAGVGRQVRTFVMDRDGVVVDELSTDVEATEAELILERTTAAAAKAPERFAPHSAHRS